MIPFCVDALLLGTDKHLVCTNEGYSWNVNVPIDIWHLDGNVKLHSDHCLDTVLKLNNVTLELNPPVQFVNVMTLVEKNPNIVIPWQRVMPVLAHRAFVKNIVDQVNGIMDKLSIDYYRDTWSPGNVVVKSLLSAKVDRDKFNALIDARVGNVRVVETFKPNRAGYTQPVTYNRFGTLTGRLTVTDGPNILTLKREYKDLLVSDCGGRIVSIDFAALEVRLLLYEAGRQCDEPDLYNMIASELGYDRKAVKGAIICELYGSSKNSLGETLGIKGQELDDFIKRIKSYFNTQSLLKRIKQRFFEKGYITNRYGRRIAVDEPLDHIFINYYAQSTGVDVTLLGFSQLVTEFARIASGIRPLFLLHDALILDVPVDCLHVVQAIKTITVAGYSQPFPLKVETISTSIE